MIDYNMIQLPQNNITVLDCFCGAGIGAIGTELAGFNTVHAFDNSKHAVKSYNANHRPVAVVQDAKTLDINSLPDADVFTGGFPCKPFSVAGKELGEGDPDHGNLGKIMVNIILTKLPKAFLLENVKGLINSKNIKFFNELIDELSVNYNVVYKCIDCSDFIPQKRERVFIVGIRKDLDKIYTFPECDNKYTIRDALQDLPKIPDNINNHYNNSKFKLRNDEKPFVHKIPLGGNWRDLDTEDQKAFMKGAFNSSGGRTGFLYKADLDKPSKTILSTPMGKSTANILDWDGVDPRRFTVRECLRLQSVPDTFKFPDDVPITKQYERCSGIPSYVSYLLMKNLEQVLTS